MLAKSPHRALIFDLTLFLFFGILIWTINIIGQSSFQGSNLFPVLMRSLILLVGITFIYYLNINGFIITLIYEIVVIAFAWVIFVKGKKQLLEEINQC